MKALSDCKHTVMATDVLPQLEERVLLLTHWTRFAGKSARGKVGAAAVDEISILQSSPLNSSAPHLHFFFFFFLMATIIAHRSSQARNWICLTYCSYRNAGSFNPLWQARDWTHTSLESQASSVGFLTPYTTAGTPIPPLLFWHPQLFGFCHCRLRKWGC